MPRAGVVIIGTRYYSIATSFKKLVNLNWYSLNGKKRTCLEQKRNSAAGRRGTSEESCKNKKDELSTLSLP